MLEVAPKTLDFKFMKRPAEGQSRNSNGGGSCLGNKNAAALKPRICNTTVTPTFGNTLLTLKKVEIDPR